MNIQHLQEAAFQYQGIDWLVTITVFIGIFLLGEKKKEGFAIGMLSAILGFIFSWQIKSMANGFSSIVLFFLYLRGFLK